MAWDDRVRHAIDAAVLCWLATADDRAQPNVSPKELFVALDDGTLAIANVASPVSVANIRVNPFVSVAFVDVFDQRGYKIVGRAVVHARGDAGYAAVVAGLAALAGPRFPIRDVIVVTPSRVAPIVAPSVTLLPERDDAERRRLAYARYGVQPLGGGADDGDLD